MSKPDDRTAAAHIPVTRDDVLSYASENRVALASGAVGGAGTFHEWLEDIGKGSGVALLKGLNLRDADLSFGDFSGIRVDGSTFEGAVLDHASFESAHLPKTCFNHTQVRDTSFVGTELSGARFAGAKIIGSGPLARQEERKNTDFTAANLSGASFDDALLRNVLFTHAGLEDATFRRAALENVRFNGANMIAVDMEGAQPQFREAKGIKRHPVGVELVGSILLGAQHMDAFAGHTEDAITTTKNLQGAIQRAAAFCHDGMPSIDHVRQQVEVRKSAGESFLRRWPQEGRESGIEAALGELKQALAPTSGFAARIREERSQPNQGKTR
ncbi:MAG: pentapeptide repeat-containing protein [Alphaproteobacteria bacterium]|nr:pentapeptide repeat-containing protein [Alphaproteobacteria bacterium]